MSEGVKGQLTQKDFQNSLIDSTLEAGLKLDVVIAKVSKKDREIFLSLRALEKLEERSALEENAEKNKEIEEASKSNLGDLIKAEMKDTKEENE